MISRLIYVLLACLLETSLVRLMSKAKYNYVMINFRPVYVLPAWLLETAF